MFTINKKKNLDFPSQLNSPSTFPSSSMLQPNNTQLYSNPSNIRLEKPTFHISSSPIGQNDSIPNNYYDGLNSSSNHSEIPSNATLMSKKNSIKTSLPDQDKELFEDQIQFSNLMYPPIQSHLQSIYTGHTPQKYAQQPGIRNPVIAQNANLRHSQRKGNSRRIWVRKNAHTATTIVISPNDIVDDLKYMIANKFPTTLAMQYDPSDLLIKLNLPNDNTNNSSRAINSSFNSTNYSVSKLKTTNSDGSHSPVYNNFVLSKPMMTNEVLRSNTPLSPEPMSNSKPSVFSVDDISNQTSPTKSLILEPDMVVWSIVDKYFPNGMSMSDAFVIDVVRSPNDETFKLDPKQRYYQGSRNLNSSIDRADISSVEMNHAMPNTNKVAILGEQKVPPPRFKHHNNSLDFASAQTPQSSAVILFSKDFRDTSKSPLASEIIPPPPSPKSCKNLNNIDNSKQSSPLPKSKSESSESRSLSTNKKLNLKVNTDTKSLNETNNNLKVPMPSSAFSTPNSDSTLTPNIDLSIPKHGKSTDPTKKSKDNRHVMPKILSHINVLVVEDNLVNQKIMARHLKSCNVQFQIASTGKEALEIWKTGGFHLCFMDIQIPVMSGIEVTKEIRRLERLNHIGSISNYNDENRVHIDKNDVLDLSLFRSPIIIVALTASTGATDQQNALAAGCNDYLTKPVQLKWLKNKLTEWGYMQALINYDYFKSEN